MDNNDNGEDIWINQKNSPMFCFELTINTELFKKKTNPKNQTSKQSNFTTFAAL